MPDDEFNPDEIRSFLDEYRRFPNNQRATAWRLALEEADRMDQERRDNIQAGQAISQAEDWRQVANNKVDYAELEQRRAEPGVIPVPREAPDKAAEEAWDRSVRNAWDAEEDEASDELVDR